MDARNGGKKVCSFVCRLLNGAPPTTDGGSVVRERQWGVGVAGKLCGVCEGGRDVV